MSIVTLIPALTFLAGLVCGTLLREAVRLIIGHDDVGDLMEKTRAFDKPHWRMVGIAAVVLALAGNGYSAVKLTQSNARLDDLSACQSQTTSDALELWSVIDELFTEPPADPAAGRERLKKAIRHYTESLALLQKARESADGGASCALGSRR